jgi:hypothetical protein
MIECYHVASTPYSPSTLDSAALAEVLAKDSQLLPPMLDLIDVMGRATNEAVLLMNAAQVAGSKQRGK